MSSASELPSGTVTFLFTDIEGSTRLLKQLGRERYGELLSRHNELLRSVFAGHGGIEVDRQGDAFFAVFRSAGSAVAAAAQAQRVLASEQWPAAASVRVRMGLHTGEAALGESGYIGLAIHLAAHVGAAAHGGQILLTSTIAKIAEDELPVGGRLRDLGERPVKGVDRPERLFQLEVEGLPESAPPPSTVSGRSHSRSLLEREAEVAALQAMIDATSGGDGRLIAIEGSPGIGKTRLVGEAQDLARSREFEVLTARGGELEGEFAFGIVRQLFEPALAVASPDTREELLSGAAELAAPLVAGAPASTSASGGAETSFAILHGLYWLAANFALRRPSLVVVDDLHWADDPSLRWLGYLARRLQGLPMLVLVAMRPPEQARAPALLTELLADPLAAVIRPGVLGRESTVTLARELLGLEPDTEFAAALHTASGGNPLYVGALLDAVAREGISPTVEQAPRLLALGPEAVSRGIALRLGRLSGEAAELARAAAVLGDGTALQLAASLGVLEATAAGRAATDLVRAGLLRREDPLEFVHPVVRTAIYEDVDAGARMSAHRRAAEILLEFGAPPEQAAAHLLRTLPSRDPFVTATLRRAASRALMQGAPEAAVAYLRRALAEPPGEQLADVLGELGSAEQLVDLAASVEHLTEAVALAVDPICRTELVLEQSKVLWLAARPAEAVDVLRTELAQLGSAASDLRERLLADLVGGALWDPDLHRIAVEQSAGIREDELCGGLGSDCLLAVLAELELRRGADRERAVTLAERALASGRLVRERALALFSATGTLLGAGELDALAAAADAALRMARRAGDIPGITALVQMRAIVAAHRGDLIAAEAGVAESLEIARAHDLANNVRYSGAFAVTIAVDRGLLTGLESLTASERRVAQLAAEDVSNKEIAQALFVTVKTVEVHLSNVYRKLEIGSRRQLAAALVGPHPEPVPAGG